MVVKTLDEMAAGGMYDLLGGGFHRYSVDDRWLVPHFEKMLYDNALLAAAYLHGWLVTGTERYREIAQRDDRVPAARAAAPRGRLRLGAGRRHRGRRGADLHLDRGGGASRRAARAVRARPLDHPRRRSTRRRARRLLAIREQRPKPLRDDKAIASWNGLALAALAEAGRRLERPDWLEAARRLGEFLLGPLAGEDGRLRRSFRDGRTSGDGYLDDYANVAHGLLELHIATGELRWLREAHRLARLAVELFADDEHGGFFLSPADGEQLVARTKELDDHPVPSGNSMLAHVLLRLARIYGDDELERRAVSVLRLLRPALERAPSAFGWGLVALDLHLSTPRELAIVGPVGSDVARAALGPWQPRTVVAVGPAEDVPLLAGKDLVGGEPAVYVCERFACRAPVTDPALV